MIEVGQRFRLLRQIGNDVAVAASGDANPLRTGSVGTVAYFVPADAAGASHHDGDAWVLNFEVTAAALDAENQPYAYQLSRSYPFSLAELDDPTLFEPA
jgi:hypothetical protein